MKRSIVFLILLILPLIAVLETSATTPTIHVYYSRYDSVYSSTSGFMGKQVTYIVSSAIYNTTISGNNNALHVTYNRTIYTLTFSKVASYTGAITVSVYTNNTIKVKSSLPNLIRVIVNSSGESELVWSGLNASTIYALAYVNETGTMILQFANGTNIANVTIPIKVNSTVTKTMTLDLEEFSISSYFTSSGQIVVATQIPKRYSPLFFSLTYNGSSYSNESGYVVTVAYFNGTLTPALVWKGLGYMFGKGLFAVGKLNVSEETIEFYGVNGTVLGYAHISTVKGEFSNNMIPVHHHTLSIYFSEIKIVTVHGVKQVHPEFVGTTYINGNEIVIIANTHGEASSTACVNFTHLVYAHGTAVLVLVSLNSTSKYIVIMKGNMTANVTTVMPNVKKSNVTISGHTYVAQKVIVNTSANYILFNVTLLNNNTHVVVYKVVNGQLVQLNSSNYFVLNGKLIIFDDPSTTYYVVYEPSTTTSLTASTVSLAPTPSSTTPSSTVSSSSSVIYIIVGIAIILIAVGIVLALRRK